MKKLIQFLLITVLSCSIVCLCKNIIYSYKDKKKIAEHIQTLPHACFKSLAGNLICFDKFNHEKPLVIIYFHPECEHCQYEAQEIGKNAEIFSNCQLVMLTSDDSLQRINSFCKTNHLWEVDNIEVLLDTNNRFKEVFGKAIIPSIYIYENKKLKKQFLGETKMETILTVLNE